MEIFIILILILLNGVRHERNSHGFCTQITFGNRSKKGDVAAKSTFARQQSRQIPINRANWHYTNRHYDRLLQWRKKLKRIW